MKKYTAEMKQMIAVMLAIGFLAACGDTQPSPPATSDSDAPFLTIMSESQIAKLNSTQLKWFEKARGQDGAKSVTPVIINASALKKSDISLSLSNGKTLSFLKHRIETINENEFTWVGSLNGIPGMATFVVNNNNVTGIVRGIDGSAYKIESIGDNGHLLIEIDTTDKPPEEPSHSMRDSGGTLFQPLQQPIASAKNPAEIDILVAYTKGAADSVRDINSEIVGKIIETNGTYHNSGIYIKLKLVDTLALAIDYSERGKSAVDISNDFVKMEAVNKKRDEVNADIAVLLVDRIFNACGRAGDHTADIEKDLGNPTFAFAVVSMSIAHGCVSNYTFAHEIGHLQGARHNPKKDPNDKPFSYGHGYCYDGPLHNNWRTIMSYDCAAEFYGATVLPFWSNPNIKHNGLPMGTEDLENNARVLNETAHTIAGYRKKEVVSNNAPIANAGGPYPGKVGEMIYFSGLDSYDPDGDSLTYSWNFGDGSPTHTGVNVSHTYTSVGTFTVRLTVNDGKSDSTSTTSSNITSPPTNPPTVPTGFTVIPVSSNQINLSWTASTSSVGVQGYKIYRGGALLGAFTATSASDMGLTTSTRYCYSVLAYDTAGKESAKSNEVCATTLAAPTESLSITTTALNPPTATVNTYVAMEAITATGGLTPYSWSGSSLPSGMVINSSTGVLYGTPTVAGTFTFTVYVADSSSPQKTASKTFSITVNGSPSTPPLSITTTTLNPPTATVNTGYGAMEAMTATGGQTPYSWSAAGLPSGMAINSSTGALYGTPTVAGTFTFTVYVADSSSPQKTASKTFSITVNGSPSSSCSEHGENDRSYQANLLPSSGGCTGTISSSSDIDWFDTYANQGTTVTFVLQVPSGLDYDMELYGPNDQIICINYSAPYCDGSKGGAGRDESITFTATATGYFAVRILGFNGANSSTSEYTITRTQ